MKISIKELVSQIEEHTALRCTVYGRRIDLIRKIDTCAERIIWISFDRTVMRYERAGIDRVFSSVPDLIDHLKKA